MRHSCLLLASHLPSGHQHGNEEMAQSRALRIIPIQLQLPGQFYLSREVPPHVLEGLKLVFLPLMKVNCCVGCLRCLCPVGCLWCVVKFRQDDAQQLSEALNCIFSKFYPPIRK